jgi:hypothetical protein
MKSTPAALTAGIRSGVIVPDASTFARPAILCTSRRISSASMLSSMMMSTPAARASLTSAALRHSTSTTNRVPQRARTRRTASAIEPALSMWLSLMRTMS